MIRVNKLRGVMAEKGVTGIQLAEELNMSPKTFYTRMKKGVFGSDEISTLVRVLEIENPAEIFFA